MQASKNSIKCIAAFLYLSLLMAPQLSNADTLIYGANAYNITDMIEINLTQQSSRMPGSTAFETQAMDQDPDTGYIYYFERVNMGNQFAYYDPATDTNTIIRTYSSAPEVNAKGMAFDPYGVLYILSDNDDLYRIDISTGDLTLVAGITDLESGPYGRTGDITFAPDGTLYVFTYSSLYSVDLSTFVSTLLYSNMIPVTSTNIWTGSAYCNGLLYASDADSATRISTLFEIDPATGVVTELFDLQTWVNDLSSCPVNGSPPPNNPPVAVAGGPYSGTEGEIILFDGTASSDPDGDALTYTWTFSDGRTLFGSQPVISFATAGSYTVSLVVSDGKVNSTASVANITISAPPVNNPPVANAGGPYSGTEGEIILFDGTASSDPDGDALTYTWTFSDGRTLFGSQPVISFATAGSYTVSLVVSDGQLSSPASVANITISPAPVNNPPVANAGGSYSGDTGDLIQFDGTASSDPDGDALTYAWTLSDGRTMSGSQPSISFATAGSYTVSLVVSDGQLSSPASVANITITDPPPVNNPPVANAGGPYSGDTGALIQFDGTASSDPDGDALTYAWTLSDGRTMSGSQPSISFATAGSYTVSLVVSDGQLSSPASVANITITDPPPVNNPPVAVPGGPYTGTAGVPFVIDGSASFDPDGDPLTYSWGRPPVVHVTGASVTWTIYNPGTYTVWLKVNDGTVDSPWVSTTITIQ